MLQKQNRIIMNYKIFLIFSSIIVFSGFIPSVMGHGIGYEILRPQQLGDRMVALEITSSQYEDPDNPDREIQFALFDVDTGITERDVTFEVTARKGNMMLFEDSFKATDGIFVFVLLPDDSNEITLTQENQASFFDSLMGSKKEVILVKGEPFKTGGLYTFDVKTSTPNSEPLEWFVGLSIPDRTFYEINDPNFGIEEFSIVTYYDVISDFQYDPAKREISFSMPFFWDLDNINQTSVVHEEMVMKKTFGDMMVAEYTALVNGHEVSDYTVTIDEFSEVQRIVHIVLNQKELLELYDKQNGNADGMDFILKPKSKDTPLSTVTGNGQYRISLDWEPEEIKSDSSVTLSFEITDVFLKGRPVLADYDLSLIHDGNVFYETSGTTTGEKGIPNEVSVVIPKDVSGPVMVQFDNLNGNSLARVGLPIVVNRIHAEAEEIIIPDWVRNNAGWWSQGEIKDSDFASGIEFMIKNEIIKVPIESTGEKTSDVAIPDWVRNNAGWWSQGEITDKDFASGIQYLITKGIISVWYFIHILELSHF